MIYRNFKDKKLSNLAFGLMRLPTKEDGSIDQEIFNKMVDIAIENGVNYFDTAYPYMNGKSEIATGIALGRHPRDTYYLANKYPGHQVVSEYKPKEIFEEQLVKCNTDYFDFYLLHNVCEHSIDVYESEKWGIVDYFIEQRKLGRIKHLGFSSHGRVDNLKRFLDKYGKELEFCQIQLNYLDWTLQSAKEKVDLLNEYNMPIWVMEPVRGGKLASMPEDITSKLRSYRPDESTAAWAFRFLQNIKGVTTILSGMSNVDQMLDNIKTFEEEKPLTEQERNYILEVGESLKQGVPCTACGYCLKGCPIGLDIPRLLSCYNDYKIVRSYTPTMFIEQLPEGKKPWDCVGCGACSNTCPQKIAIPQTFKELIDIFNAGPTWAETSRKRELEAKANKNK